MDSVYLDSVIKQFQYYQSLGEKAMEQVPDEALFWQPDEESNSIAIIVNHLSGNMMSRWTDFLFSDGEKEWRNRDGEFEKIITSRAVVMAQWKKGWDCLHNALGSLKGDDLTEIVYIRNQGHTVMEAINRQLSHYPYHVGQIIFIAKMMASKWKSLSIAKGDSVKFNAEKFSETKRKQHFTDDLSNQQQ